MIITFSDPNDAAILGELFNSDPLPDDALTGGTFNLFFSSTGSDDNEILFDLSEPPSFFGPPMVSGSVDQQDTLNLFLSPTTGDSAHPFAQLPSFSGLAGGQGDLTRSNKLPPVIDWSVQP